MRLLPRPWRAGPLLVLGTLFGVALCGAPAVPADDRALDRAAGAAGERAADRVIGGRFAFRTYGEDAGLGNLTVECMLQDRDGFLWIGTQDGLFRFDGRRFVRFGREQGLPSSRINSLHQTARGRLYAGTRDGVAVLVPALAGERFRALGGPVGLPHIAIPDQGIASDPAGRLFVGTPAGLFVAAGERFRREPAADPEAPEDATGLHWSPAAGGSLVYAHGSLLFRRAGDRPADTVEIGRAAGLPPGERIDQTATDAGGSLWVRTRTQLWVLRPGAARFVRDDRGLPPGVAVGRLALDDRGRLMVPTTHGLARRAGGGWRLIGQREGLESDAVLSALVDREGSLWIGLAGVGLAQQLGRGAFTAWGSAEGLSHDVVWAIARESGRGGSPGALWIGTEGGLDRLDLATGALRSWKARDGLGGDTVYALTTGPDGSIWAGSWPGGVTRFGPEPGRMRRYQSGDLPPQASGAIALYFDRRGDLWAGTSSGAMRLPAGSASTRFTPVRLPGWDTRDSVYGFAEDRAGTVWAVGRYGLQRLTGPDPRRFRTADGLAAEFLASIVPGAPGEPWELLAGYREALGAVGVAPPPAGNSGRPRLFPLDASSGLSFDKVVFLGRDATGALWVGGGAGVDVFRRPGQPPLHFGRPEGLITEDMSQNAFLAEPDGTVWLGTSRGLVRYRAGAGALRRLPPPILLTEVEAGGRRLDPAAPALLGRDERALRAAWTSPTFLQPKKIRFRYRLAGLEEDWVETAAGEVRFPTLPTGRYRLEVVAVDGEKANALASTRPAVFAFSVRPAWWQRGWAHAAGAVLAALAVAGLIRLRTRALEADRRRLEAAVAERSAALARAVRELEEASFTDPLTRVRNRRFLTSIIDGEVAATLRAHSDRGGAGRDLVVYLIDVDHFKSVNDSFGHAVGDRLLVEVAARLAAVVRQGDMLVRWGGEEFLVVARGTDRDEAEQLAGRLLAALGGQPFDLGGGLVVERTCSVGWAPFPWFPDAPEALTFDQVLTLADRALYLAKSGGRDCAVGALPSGRAAEVTARHPGWWSHPLAQGEGRWARLVRSRASLHEAPAAAAGA